MDILSDIGGVYQLFISIFGFLLFKFSKHSFTLNVLEKLFYVKTKNEDTFTYKKDLNKSNSQQNGMEKYLDKCITRQIQDQNLLK